MNVCLRELKESNRNRCQEQGIDYIPYYLWGLSGAHFFRQPFLKHPRRPRGSQSGWEKRRDESFQVRAKEPLGTDSHQAVSKNSSGCRLLIGHKKCFVLLCPIRELFLLISFRAFVHDGYRLDYGLSCSCTKKMHAVRKLSIDMKSRVSISYFFPIFLAYSYFLLFLN